MKVEEQHDKLGRLICRWSSSVIYIGKLIGFGMGLTALFFHIFIYIYFKAGIEADIEADIIYLPIYILIIIGNALLTTLGPILISLMEQVPAIYEKGAIPARVPLKYITRKREFIITWEDVVYMKFEKRPPLFGYPSGWIYKLYFTKDGKIYCALFGSYRLSDECVEIVLQKLKDVEEKLRKDGRLLPYAPKGVGFYL